MSPALAPDSLAAVLLAASDVLGDVMGRGRSLTDALAHPPGSRSPAGRTALAKPDVSRAAVQDVTYTAVRQWARSQALLDQLTDGRPLRPRALADLLATALALAADPLRQRYDPHTLVDQAVRAADARKDTRPGKGLVNACLRRYYRERDALHAHVEKRESVRYGVPDWWLKHVRKQQPQQWQSVFESTRTPPALTLRVNRRKTSVAAFIAACEDAGLKALAAGSPGFDLPPGVLELPGLADAAGWAHHTVWLPEPVPVYRIPGFMEGHVSVQDMAAQWATPLLAPADGARVLDACCAPGGKTGHLLEWADLDLTALDVDANRLQRVQDNLARLGLLSDRVTLKAADAACLSDWWDGQLFDAVLADVPCTGSGVIRRHPDIPWLRRPTDVASMSQLQRNLLDVLWSVLRPGGTLLIVTCSLFGEEGEQLLAHFRSHHPDAVIQPAPGLVLPRSQVDGPGHDGFFYARLQKGVLAHA